MWLNSEANPPTLVGGYSLFIRVKMAKRKKHKEDPFDTPEYRTLLDDLSKIINEAKAQGVDFGGRDDILKCRACGAQQQEVVRDQIED
jgi:hypothetical protein